MKFSLTALIFSFFVVGFSFADQPSTAPTNQSSAIYTADDAKSVLIPGAAQAPTVLAETPKASVETVSQQNCCAVSDKKVVYRNKRKIAPCAVQQLGNLSFHETEIDACCNKSCRLEKIDVPFCAPPCACKEDVSTSRDGRKVVHDYGRYGVVLKAKRNGTVEVDYKKRLFNR